MISVRRDAYAHVCEKRKGHSGRPSISEEVIDAVRQTFPRSPKKSTRRCSRELQVPQSTVSKILRKHLKFFLYKLQLVQKLHPEDNEKRFEFCCNLLVLMENDPDLLSKIIFSDEALFHVKGEVNRHNVRIWGSQNPHVILEV